MGAARGAGKRTRRRTGRTGLDGGCGFGRGAEGLFVGFRSIGGLGRRLDGRWRGEHGRLVGRRLGRPVAAGRVGVSRAERPGVGRDGIDRKPLPIAVSPGDDHHGHGGRMVRRDLGEDQQDGGEGAGVRHNCQTRCDPERRGSYRRPQEGGEPKPRRGLHRPISIQEGRCFVGPVEVRWQRRPVIRVRLSYYRTGGGPTAISRGERIGSGPEDKSL